MDTEHEMPPPSHWVPLSDPRKQAAIGKLMEEAGELVSILSRISIQGLDGVDPDTGIHNITALIDELGDVRGLSNLVIDELMLDRHAVERRAERKRQHKEQWLAMLGPPTAIAESFELARLRAGLTGMVRAWEQATCGNPPADYSGSPSFLAQRAKQLLEGKDPVPGESV